MLAGFDELILSGRTEDARNQIGEAIRCYEGGAYRAAIVMTYMAVCFDLIDKLKALDASGDNVAKQLVSDLQKHQQQLDSGNPQALASLLAFERSLLEKFRDEFEFFGTNEFSELARLRDDRNRCAHPTFFKTEQPYKPSPELARLHIRNALDLVLSQEPRQGKAALAEIQRIVLSQYFPVEVEGAVERLKIAGLPTARDALIRAAVDDIVFGLPDKNHPFYGKTPAYVALEAIIEIRRAIALPRAGADVTKLLKSAVDENIQIGSLLALRNAEVADAVEPGVRPIIGSWIEKNDVTPANAVRRGLGIPWLKASALKRLASLTADELSKPSAKFPPEMLQRAADLYCEAKNWDKANDLAQKVAIPFADTFDAENIDFIFEKATNGQADLQGSHGFKLFINKLYEESPIGKGELDKLTEKYDLESYRP